MDSSLALPMGRHVKGLTGTSYADLSIWPFPDEGALPPAKLKTYRLRKKAVEMYLEGHSEKAITERCGTSLKHIYRLITERCLAPHADGLIYGWRGLIPNLRIKPYRRKRKVRIDLDGKGGAGALTLALETHPDLRLRLDKRILASPTKTQLGPIKRPRRTHWLWFLAELTKLGYETRNEWPFNTKSMGYLTICRYIDSVLATNPERAVRVIGGPDLERKLLSGDGVNRPIAQIYERVEMDAHKIDGIFCVLMPHAAGGHVARTIHRIWVIAIIDIVSKAVLGYHLSLNREVNKNDVLRTIKSALNLWRPRPISFGEAYIQGAGFPANVSEKFLRACWNETCVDGALAETCTHIRDALKNVVGSTLVTPSHGFSSRRSKDDRPFIESFFKKLGVYGFQRISNSTGGKAGDTGGRDPALVAVNSQFQYEYAQELLDVLIANYNATAHTALGYRSPLQFLQFMSTRQEMSFRYADPNSVQALLSYRKKCRVCGGLEVGRKPYVNFEGARYSSDVLGQRYDLVGTDIWVTNHLEDDARVAQASLPNGLSLGVLRAAPPWNKLPHSLTIRRAINSCSHQGVLRLTDGGDAIESFLKYCESQSHRKLPPHPAYLELRRILAQEAEPERGPSSEADFRMERDLQAYPATKHSSLPSKPTLPARRMASTK